jgi:hypothetical protein
LKSHSRSSQEQTASPLSRVTLKNQWQPSVYSPSGSELLPRRARRCWVRPCQSPRFCPGSCARCCPATALLHEIEFARRLAQETLVAFNYCDVGQHSANIGMNTDFAVRRLLTKAGSRVLFCDNGQQERQNKDREGCTPNAYSIFCFCGLLKWRAPACGIDPRLLASWSGH